MLHLQCEAALPEVEIFVCVAEEQGKKWAALERLSPPHSLNRAITCTTAFPSYSFWNKTGFKHLFSEKPSRRSAYFCGSFLQHNSNSFSFVFSANWISKLLLITLCIPGSCRIGLVFLLCVLAKQCTAILCSTMCRFGTGLSRNALHIKAQA